jgi:signal transduction histidine kinase
MILRWLPDSVFGRLMTALLAVVGVTVLTIAVMIVRERQDLAFRGSGTQDLVQLIAETSKTLAELPPPGRAEEVSRLQQTPPIFGRRVQRVPLSERNAAVMRRWFREFADRLARQLGNDYRVDLRPVLAGIDAANVIRIGGEAPFVRVQRGDEVRVPNPARPGGGDETTERGQGDGSNERSGFERRSRAALALGGTPQIDVVVTLPDSEQVTFRTVIPPAEPPLPKQIFVELGLLTAVLGVVLYLMARTITGPLSDLARAAEAVGRGARHLPLRETGARELRDATRAFNVMQERLHRYLDSRTRVLAAMSHDLRTPLTRLKLRVESLDSEALRERFVADLDEMNDMVNGALSLFRGMNEDEPERPVEVAPLLDELRAEFAEVGESVTLESAASALIVARPHALKRCLANLISNAVKYGERARVVVEDTESELVLHVIDDGPGIPTHELERVFEPFFRLESSRNAATGGTGLGLGIARDIAQAHGGSIVLRNRAPHGLEAILRLPKAPLRG